MTREEAREAVREAYDYGDPEYKEEIIRTLEQEPRWIPCSERLPETTKYVSEGEFKWYESEKCLIWFANEYAVATFNKDELTDEEDDSDGFYVVDRHYWYGLSVDDSTYPYNDVIAWMPLPQAYGAESEEQLNDR